MFLLQFVGYSFAAMCASVALLSLAQSANILTYLVRGPKQ